MRRKGTVTTDIKCDDNLVLKCVEWVLDKASGPKNGKDQFHQTSRKDMTETYTKKNYIPENILTWCLWFGH